MAFVPSPKSTLNTPASIRNYQMEGSLYLGNTSELTDPWPAFMNIKFIESTFFIITFKEDIENSLKYYLGWSIRPVPTFIIVHLGCKLSWCF
ncbi:uncharacterized protein PGTG_21942 [Puccinia graminis f. sp. tritici CRL 75-36-700-3]|uniref:Uncharacterized protein n=1 Tax=Puccinia graminis f. sp. tritici (strain CRL 75-36-700-3 / race SCCL) TaxID=418459 RepID=H6QSW9_PUCGT|nr:uncharacterized protein PGTG_21942 [Puccinia graminis f. sp. tritici CRL 75-36-700-3]EHS63923.1 hypothetical protein PGTG_21942 [Puccinia graminis f. sp. tritici CRL 75-36-700-3]